MPVALLFVLAAVEVLHRTSARASSGVLFRAAFVGLCVVGAGVSFLSVRVPYEQWYDTVSQPALVARYDQGRPFAPPGQPSMLRTPYDFTFRASQIRGDIDLLDAGAADMAPADLQGSDPLTGWILLVLGGSALAGAAVVALRADNRGRTKRPTGSDPVNRTGVLPARSPG